MIKPEYTSKVVCPKCGYPSPVFFDELQYKNDFTTYCARCNSVIILPDDNITLIAIKEYKSKIQAKITKYKNEEV